MNSALYTGRLVHVRSAAVGHRFAYRLCLPLIDLDELPALFDLHWAWSARRPAPIRFRREDHLGEGDLAEAVRARVASELGVRPEGPIRMLASPRHFGFAMNPIAVFYCFEEGADAPMALLGSVTNTPWNERHHYVVDLRGPDPETPKAFHVSPFQPMDLRYRWRAEAPGERLRLAITCLRGDERVFHAELRAEREPWTRAALARVFWRHGFQPQRVWLGIYFQALRLWLRGAPFFAHPSAQETPG